VVGDNFFTNEKEKPAMGQTANLVRSYEYDIKDLAVAFYKVVVGQHGGEAVRGVKRHWYRRRNSVNFFSVKVGVGEEAKGILGPVSVGEFSAHFFVGGDMGEPQIFVAEVPQTLQRVSQSRISVPHVQVTAIAMTIFLLAVGPHTTLA